MIHQTAVVDPGAELGRDVTVGPFAYIEPDVRIGDGCVIGPHASLLRYTTLGPQCRVHSGAVIGDLPQDVGFGDGASSVLIGARCRIREGVSIHRGTKPGSATVVGDDCCLMGFSHYAHNVRLGNRVIVVNGSLLAGYVEVGDGAFISGNCVVHQFVRIGRLAMLGGGSGVSKDVPPFCTARSMSRNTLAGLNVVGLRRAGMAPDVRREVRRAFAALFRSGLNLSEAVAQLRAGGAAGPALEFCEFVEQSKRGVCTLKGGAEADDGGEA